MRTTALLLAILMLYGCAPTTAIGVREMGAERRVAFEAPANYQAVYRKVLDQSRKCWQSGMVTAQMVVTGDLYTDIRSGTITVAMHGALGVDTYQVIDISALDDTRSKVVGHYAAGPVEQFGHALRQWVLADATDCRPAQTAAQ